MGKTTFLEHYQKNLCEKIQEILDTWRNGEFECICEDNSLSNSFSGFVDISIKSKNDDKKVVAIEIEHKSSFNGSFSNVKKMKKWAHDSQNRKVAMYHLFNEDCNISEYQIDEIFKFAKENEKKSCGFFYDFSFYPVTDYRETRETAQKLVNSREFKARLWMLMKLVELV